MAVKLFFFGRFVPIVRSLISVPAGMAHYSFSRFLGLSTLGTLLWNAVLISAGFLAGDHWQGILATIESVSDLVLISSLLMLSGFSFWLYRKKKNREVTKGILGSLAEDPFSI
ncbi:DedA family protein [Secundilactobacillus kimchicus]|uniref:DedA family protein n=1 Tax=Secundilactobacillus kimchicus TaxID=528209 RepID=UPI000AD74193